MPTIITPEIEASVLRIFNKEHSLTSVIQSRLKLNSKQVREILDKHGVKYANNAREWDKLFRNDKKWQK